LAASPPDASRRLTLLEQGPLFNAAIFACIALTLAGQLSRPAPPDMAFLLYAAGRLLDGATLYRNVVEINPPLVIWLNVPIELLARTAHVSEFVVYRLVTAAVVGALFGFSYQLLRWYVLPDQPAYGRYLLLLLCFALFPLAGDDFGQREHFVLALLTPYILLVAAQRRGAALRGVGPHRSERVVIGVLAGVALALKPHFVLAWLALVFFQPARGRWRAAPEVAWTLTFLGVYAVIVLLATPEYLTMALALGPAYLRYLREPWYSLLLLAPGAPLVIFSLLAAAVLRRFSRDPVLWLLLATEVVACYLAGMAQQKGLRYHFYPSFALAFVLLGLVAADAPRAAGRLSERLYARVVRVLAVTIALVVVGLGLIAAAGGTPADRRARGELDDLASLVRARAAGGSIGVLSYRIDGAFPLVNYAGVRLASRFPHLWLFPASYLDSLEAGGALVYNRPDQMQAPERYLWDTVQEDLVEAQPRLLLVLRPARDDARNGLRRLHYIQYFERDPELAKLFRRYELVADKGEYEVYEQVKSGATRTGPAPSAAPGVLDVRLAQPHEVRVQSLDPGFLAGFVLFAGLWVVSLLLDRVEASRRAGGL
jgi:hypothetical protein